MDRYLVALVASLARSRCCPKIPASERLLVAADRPATQSLYVRESGQQRVPSLTRYLHDIGCRTNVKGNSPPQTQVGWSTKGVHSCPVLLALVRAQMPLVITAAAATLLQSLGASQERKVVKPRSASCSRTRYATLSRSTFGTAKSSSAGPSGSGAVTVLPLATGRPETQAGSGSSFGIYVSPESRSEQWASRAIISRQVS